MLLVDNKNTVQITELTKKLFHCEEENKERKETHLIVSSCVKNIKSTKKFASQNLMTIDKLLKELHGKNSKIEYLEK